MSHIDVRARRTDPETSHQAALDFEADQSKAGRSVRTVVEILSVRGALTDFEIRLWWPHYWDDPFSYTLPSKARHWARQQGKVRHAGFAPHEGRKVRLWDLGTDDVVVRVKRCPHCGGALA